MKTLAIAILALTAFAVGQKKTEKKAPEPVINGTGSQPLFGISPQPLFRTAGIGVNWYFSPDTPCLYSFVYDAKANTCTITITFTTPSPVTCTSDKDNPQTFTCTYKPKEPK